MERIESVEFGNGTGRNDENLDEDKFNIAIDSYNNAIKILNEKAESYINPTYAKAARSVGSVPNNPNSESGMYTREDSWFAEYNEKFKDSDNNYLLDWNQMNTLGIYNLGNNYWLASREVETYDNSNYFRIRLVHSSGTLYSRDLFSVNSSQKISYSATRGLRSVFTLKEGLKVTGGSGTEDEPYNLGV